MRPAVPSVILLPCALLLAACPPNDAARGKSRHQVTTRSVEGDAPAVKSVRAPTDDASPLSKIPAPFIGHWKPVAESCNPDDGKSGGNLTIAGDRLLLDGQSGTFSDLSQIQPTQIRLDLSMNVDGVSQPAKAMSLILLDGGQTLESQESVMLELPIITRYRRCPV